jgi:hypothetical protein
MSTGTSLYPVPKAMASHSNPKDLPWVPWAEGHFIKLIKLNPITGQIILFHPLQSRCRPPNAFPPGYGSRLHRAGRVDLR